LWSDGTLEFERTITETGVYGVVVSNVCDIAEDEIIINIEDCDYGMYLPNAFTPDGDGLNEVWLPVVLNLESFRIVVYNRWGEEVWSTETEGEFWNGSHQQGSYYVTDGIYAYRGVGKSIQGKTVEVSGSIVVLR
jgi:gliding motility-associated-like protein